MINPNAINTVIAAEQQQQATATANAEFEKAISGLSPAFQAIARQQYNAKEKSLIQYALQVGSAVGVNLTEDDLANIKKTYGSAASLDSVRDLLLANISRIKSDRERNPVVDDATLSSARDIIGSVYGREVSDDEAQYFAKELARGKSRYELQQELMSLPEYQRTEAEKDRLALNAELQGQQAEVFKRASPNIISAFMRAGRLNSSGLNSALAQAQADLDKERQSSLAQVGTQDIRDIRANAFSQFQQMNQPYQQARNLFSTAGSYQTGMGLMNQSIARQREIEDYNRQQSDYMRYLQMANKGDMFSNLLGAGLDIGKTLYTGSLLKGLK